MFNDILTDINTGKLTIENILVCPKCDNLTRGYIPDNHDSHYHFYYYPHCVHCGKKLVRLTRYVKDAITAQRYGIYATAIPQMFSGFQLRNIIREEIEKYKNEPKLITPQPKCPPKTSTRKDKNAPH